MIAESVAFLAAQGKRVIYDAEHFFDGYPTIRTMRCACLRAAAEAGAETVILLRHQRRLAALRSRRRR